MMRWCLMFFSGGILGSDVLVQLILKLEVLLKEAEVLIPKGVPQWRRDSLELLLLSFVIWVILEVMQKVVLKSLRVLLQLADVVGGQSTAQFRRRRILLLFSQAVVVPPSFVLVFSSVIVLIIGLTVLLDHHGFNVDDLIIVKILRRQSLWLHFSVIPIYCRLLIEFVFLAFLLCTTRTKLMLRPTLRWPLGLLHDLASRGKLWIVLDNLLRYRFMKQRGARLRRSLSLSAGSWPLLSVAFTQNLY